MSGKGLALALAGAILLMAGALPATSGERTQRQIPVPAATIYPGEVIRAAMLRLRPVSARYYARGGFVAEAGRIVGKMARRTLVRGRPVPPNALREPYAVFSGKAVQVIYRSAGLSITILGTALESASSGEVVAVRNVDSGRIIHGVAQKDGTVLVKTP